MHKVFTLQIVLPAHANYCRRPGDKAKTMGTSKHAWDGHCMAVHKSCR